VPADPPDQVHETDHNGRNQNQPEERVREAAVMCESKDRSLESTEYIEVGRLGGQGHGGGCKSSSSIESGPPKASAGEKVRDGFQGLSGLS
jgi:hypothetical protein